MGLIGRVFSLIGFLVLVLVGLGAYLYFTDYEVDATVTSRESDGSTNFITVTPNKFPYDVKQEVNNEAYQFVCEGYAVKYRVASGFTSVYDRENDLVWDSENGLNDIGRTLMSRC